ncbi:hypothetical protein MHYP_G00170740 [Metynnis hypsauchen]
MSPYIRAFFLSLATWAGSVSAQSTVFTSATVGSSAVLPCDWRNIATTESASQTPHVVWRTFAGTVCERRGGELFQGEGYEDRVDVPEDNLLKGNCSLELKNVRPEDAGLYESFLVVRRMKRSLNSKQLLVQIVELSVDDAPEESHSESKAAAGGGAGELTPFDQRVAGIVGDAALTGVVDPNVGDSYCTQKRTRSLSLLPQTWDAPPASLVHLASRRPPARPTCQQLMSVQPAVS